MRVNCLHYLCIWPVATDFELQEADHHLRALVLLKWGLYIECKAIFYELVMASVAPQEAKRTVLGSIGICEGETLGRLKRKPRNRKKHLKENGNIHCMRKVADLRAL